MPLHRPLHERAPEGRQDRPPRRALQPVESSISQASDHHASPDAAAPAAQDESASSEELTTENLSKLLLLACTLNNIFTCADVTETRLRLRLRLRRDCTVTCVCRRFVLELLAANFSDAKVIHSLLCPAFVFGAVTSGVAKGLAGDAGWLEPAMVPKLVSGEQDIVVSHLGIG